MHHLLVYGDDGLSDGNLNILKKNIQTLTLTMRLVYRGTKANMLFTRMQKK